MRTFFPLRDPITDLHRVLIEHSEVDLHVYVSGRFAGSIRTSLSDQIGFMNLLIGRHLVAEQDDSGNTTWHMDYDKRVVIEDNGGIVAVTELE